MINYSEALKRFPLQLVAVVWVTGALLTYGSVSSIAHAIRIKKELAVQTTVPAPSGIERVGTPLAATDVDEIVKRLAVLHPAVKIASSGNGNVRMAIDGPAQYGDWRSAIADLLQSGTPDTAAETLSICGAGCNGVFGTAEFSLKKIRFAAK